MLNLGSAAFDSNTRASALAIQLKITQDLLQQKESERTLTAQEFMSAEVDLVASLQRTIQEQKEKIERLERASEADIAKYNTLLDNLSFKQGRGQTCSC
jgi:biopolymer transport protein ExbB/TolQ